MTNPYLTSHSLYAEFQKAYESVMSGSGLVFKACPQQSSLVFGLRVGQTEPSNYFNNLIPCSACLHNPFSDSRFKKVPVRVIYSQSSSAINIHHNPCEVANSLPNNQHLADPHFVRAMPVSIINPRTNSEQLQQNIHPTRNELHFNAFASSSGESLPLSHDKPDRKANAQPGKISVAKQAQAKPGKEIPCTEAKKRKAYYKAWSQSERGKAMKRTWENSEKGKTCRRAYRKTYAHSEKGKAYSQSKERKAYLKAYSQSERAKAARRAYRHSEKGRATQRAWEQSLKRKAYKKAYSQSERGKASKRAYAQSEKGKATYRARKQSLKMMALQSDSHEAFKHTSDQEKITGKQATVLSAQPSEATEYK